MFRFKVKNLVIIFLLFVLCSCGGNSFNYNAAVELADNFATENHFTKEYIKGGDFTFTVYHRIKNYTSPFIIYIEGDGRSMSHGITNNPTPKKLMLLKLAAMDHRDNVVYLARPCQYTPPDLNPKCKPVYWTDKRFSPDSVSAMHEAIKSLSKNNDLHLIGFSGGGGVCILIAKDDKNVKSIITIAGNLDHKAFNNYHSTLPCIGSLNPIDYAKEVIDIPQLHLSGGKDKVVPSFIGKKYVDKSDSGNVKHMTIPDATHMKNWDTVWEKIIDDFCSNLDK